MPTAYSYIRVSHEQSKKSGLSPQAQLVRCRQYYQFKGLARQDVEFYQGELLYDPAVSARHVPFLKRPMGSRLHAMLQAGDHLIFAYLDRGFRALLDYAQLIERWKVMVVNVHFADLAVDLSTPQGMLVANIMASVAQGQSDMYSQRQKGVMARLKAQKRPVNQQKKPGFKRQRVGDVIQWVPDVEERQVMQFIAELREQQGLSWRQISAVVERRICEFENREFRDSAFCTRKWSFQRCHFVYKCWKQILEEENP